MKQLKMLAICMAITACSANEDYRTHLYPGNPEEDASPVLVKDNDYRNLALNRAAYASSSRDYNLTAQLVTDGLLPDGGPKFFELSTPQGPVERNRKEWAFDMKTNSKLEFPGPNSWLQLDFFNYNVDFDHIQLVINIYPEVNKEKYYGVPGQEAGAINPSQKAEQLSGIAHWRITLQASKDGNDWTDLDSVIGTGNRIFESLSKSGNWSHYRLVLESDIAAVWSIADWDFYREGVQIIPTPQLMTESYIRDGLSAIQPGFSSAWMSAGEKDEWIYVDLGTSASVKKVKLHWLSGLPQGKLEISDDAREWKAVADIAPEIKLSKKARYLRLALESGGPFILGEFEVYGRGGLIARSKEQSGPKDGRMDLRGGEWKLTRASLVNETPEQVSSNGYDASSWMAATVPGTVLSSYINVGAVPDPNYSDNQLQISESYFLGDFWYRDEFVLPEGFRKEKLFLNFDGINWKAEVFVNGKRAGRIDGAFTRGVFDVSDLIQEGLNSLAVKILSPAHPGTIKEQTALSTDSNGGMLGADNPTFHASVGWDWIPTIRGREAGIWNDVYLTTTGSVRLSEPFVRSELNLPDTTKASIFVEAKLKNYSRKSVSGKLCGSLGEHSFSQDVRLAPGEERIVEVPSFVIDNPKLWWPVGYGEPHLYDAELRFEQDGAISDFTRFKYGIRQMDSDIVDGALMLYINGRRFIGRGGNWGFSESNLAYRGREYDIAVRYHADMNFTMIRNWVGQIGDEEFYEACDRHGVMIWQDFWLANPWDGPDPYNEAMFMDNAEDYVKRIRNHASIGLYCGRNEGMPTLTLDAGLRQLVSEMHPGMKYISHSADSEVSGGGPYRALPVKSYFNLSGANRFHSERGMPNVMNYESLVRTIPEDRLWPQNSLWGIHDFTLESAQYGNSFNGLLEQGFGPASDAREFTQLAQWINYNGYRAMFEGRSEHRQGLLLWMSHSCWPSMVWQTYDYYFDPTAAYFACKKASEPLHIQYNALSGKVEVINLSAGNGRKLVARAEVLDMYGRQRDCQEQNLVSDEDSTIECMAISIPDDISPVYFIRLSLLENGSAVSENFYWEGVEEGNYQALRDLPKAKVAVASDAIRDGDKWICNIELSNKSDTPALMLRVKVENADSSLVLPLILSDNYFFLMPGESKSIRAEFNGNDFHGRTPRVEVEGFNL